MFTRTRKTNRTDRGSLLIIEKSHSFQALVDHTGHVILPLVITKPVMCPFNAWKFPFDSQRCLVFFYADIIESLHALEITEDAIDMPEVGEWKVKNFFVKENGKSTSQLASKTNKFFLDKSKFLYLTQCTRSDHPRFFVRQAI